MRKLFSILLVLATISACSSNKKQMEIQGSVDDETLINKKVYLFENWDKSDSTIITDKKFSFTTSFDSVQVYRIGIEGKRNFDVILADKPGIVTVHYNKGSNFASINDKGGVNSFCTDLAITINGVQKNEHTKIKRMREQKTPTKVLDSIMKVNKIIINRMWRSSAMINKNNLAGAAILEKYNRQASSEEFIELYKRIKYANLFPQLTHRKEVCENQEKTKEGQMFVDFEGKDLKGEKVSLSDYVGKGKYVLVDFWASWCGPCRAEIPNIIKVYKQFAGKKLTVLGVDLWDKEDKFKKAVEEEKIEYPQIFGDKDNKGGALYGIQSIPHIILFGPDGKILKRGLRGEAIAESVEEVLKK